MKVKTIIQNGIKYLGKHSPTILAGAAVAGVIATGVLSARGHLKASEIVKTEKKKRENEAYREFHTEDYDTYTQDELEDIAAKKSEIPKLEKFKMTWLCYLPAAISAVLSIASIIASHSISQKRLAAMSILLSSAETALSKYEGKVTEMFGKAKADKIKEAIADDAVPSHIAEDGVALTKHGDTLFYDRQIARPFRCSMEYILKCQNDLNKDLINGGEVSLNDFYYMLDLDGCRYGDYVGFNPEVPLDIDFTSKTLDDGQQITLIDFPVHPRWDDLPRATLF